MSKLLDLLLEKPVGPAIAQSKATAELTREIEVNGDKATVVLNTAVDEPVLPTDGLDEMKANGLNPEDWEASGFRSSEWTMANGDVGVSTRWSFTRRRPELASEERPNLDELLARVNQYTPSTVPSGGQHGYIVALGDMQFGKIDGDGAEGTLQRTIDCIHKAADLLAVHRKRFDIGRVHIAWLGDHVEGFVSQGGANTFRTTLTMNEQIRLTRRVMLEALVTFNDLTTELSMAAVPGNHGEPQRFGGKGVTRYDDSHDTESLIAIADVVNLHPELFNWVKFYVPETDELTVTVDVAGTIVSHVHGHQFRRDKYFDWWRGQAFNPASSLGKADLLLAGHLHHEHIESDGKRLFIQVPSLESESTWYRHTTGTSGNPGIFTAITKDGVTNPMEFVR